MKRRGWLILLLAAGLCAGLAAVWQQSAQPDAVAPTSVEAPRDFGLTDTAGQKVSLATYRGKWLLVFFGFTNCPDACPTAMLNISATLRELGDKADSMQPIFITIDPERDTPAILKEYLANFGDQIAGLSGSSEDIAAVAKAYGVFYRKRPMEGGDYTMDHSTALYLVAPDGHYVRAYVPDMDPAQFADALRRLMAASS